MCTGDAWRGVPRSPSHESVTTDLSLFSVSSAASDAKVLRVLACKAGQGPDPSLRVASPNPEGKCMSKRRSWSQLEGTDNWRELLAGCAALCTALRLRRAFSDSDVVASGADTPEGIRTATSEVGLSAALEALTVTSRSCSTWAAAGGSQVVSPQRAAPPPPPPQPALGDHRAVDNRKVRQNYIKRRLVSTYRALERMSQSEFNLDKLEAAAVSAIASAVSGPGPTILSVPQYKMPHARFIHPEAANLALTAADLERERGRPLSKYERNMMIFNWLHTLDDAQPF